MLDKLPKSPFGVNVGSITSLTTGAPDLSLGTVNGDKFYTPYDMLIRVILAANRGDKEITITTHQPEVIAAYRWMEGKTKEEIYQRILDYITTEYRIDPHTSFSSIAGVDDTAAILLGVAAIIGAVCTGIAAILAASGPVIIAVGIAIFLALLGVAIIYAIHEGYDVKNVDVTAVAGMPHIAFSLEKK